MPIGTGSRQRWAPIATLGPASLHRQVPSMALSLPRPCRPQPGRGSLCQDHVSVPMAVSILGSHHRAERWVERGQNACQAHGFRATAGSQRQDGTMTCVGTQAGWEGGGKGADTGLGAASATQSVPGGGGPAEPISVASIWGKASGHTVSEAPFAPNICK